MAHQLKSNAGDAGPADNQVTAVLAEPEKDPAETAVDTVIQR